MKCELLLPLPLPLLALLFLRLLLFLMLLVLLWLLLLLLLSRLGAAVAIAVAVDATAREHNSLVSSLLGYSTARDDVLFPKAIFYHECLYTSLCVLVRMHMYYVWVCVYSRICATEDKSFVGFVAATSKHKHTVRIHREQTRASPG